eukprot:1379126-Lingulodinium_polyedra.AAC.1
MHEHALRSAQLPQLLPTAHRARRRPSARPPSAKHGLPRKSSHACYTILSAHLGMLGARLPLYT